MTTTFDATDAITKYWRANWTGTTKTALRGENYKPTAGEEWVEFEVRQRRSSQDSQGAAPSRRFLRVAEARILVHTPVTGGEKRGLQLADEARALLEAKTIGELRFHGGAEVREQGVEGVELVNLVICPFDYQEIK